MSKEKVPKNLDELLEHFRPLEQEPEVVRMVRDELPAHLFVDDDGDRYHAWCSHCREWVHLPKSRHKAKVECPSCGETADIIHTWRGYKNLVDRTLTYIYSKSAKSPEDIITARAVYMEYRWYQENAQHTTYTLPWDIVPYVAVDSYYVFVYGQGAVQARPVNNRKCSADYGTPRLVLSKSVNDRWGVYAYGSFGAPRYITLSINEDTIDDAVKDTPFHYVWDEIGGSFTDRGTMRAYLQIFTKLARYPFAAETLAKLGNPTRDWLYSLTEGGHTAGGILNWRGKTITRMLRYSLTKEEKLWLRTTESTSLYIGHIFATWSWLRKQGNTSITLADMDRFHIWAIADIKKAQEVISLPRLIRYLGRQQKEHSHHVTITMGIYIDYLNDCRELGADITKKSVFMPRDLVEAHDALNREIRQIRELQREEEELKKSRGRKNQAGQKNKLYKKLRKKILQQYAFEADGMMIYVPKKLEELIDEGIAMHSCVGGYVDRVAEGKTIVVFIRAAADHRERIGTMEISKDGTSIIQARAKYNQNLSPAAADFVKKFKETKIDKIGRKTA
ncbi:PcfJ domain-containing protein [Selenomonas sp. AE3005]|uniref:PcfJ domain-containing protein n=1 Tax=Selenomonas sp. AE3005 TaxID=1485543 RepID=UPI0025F00D20|nr:PcfJ domain-containing protein [Selenomonas sp. AE3005]